ncbi:hypothetical protein AB0B12_39270 [Streptomyces sp. NPDC044780]|uniref:hypothetical protein n=1 Tax=unclassified Streptomyces TaxID=2593676 RepID=UPI0033D18C78
MTEVTVSANWASLSPQAPERSRARTCSRYGSHSRGTLFPASHRYTDYRPRYPFFPQRASSPAPPSAVSTPTLNYQGLTDHAPSCGSYWGPSSRLAALGLVTEQPIAATLTRAATGQPAALGALHLVVAAEVWLRQLAATPAPWWQEVTSGVAAA